MKNSYILKQVTNATVLALLAMGALDPSLISWANQNTQEIESVEARSTFALSDWTYTESDTSITLIQYKGSSTSIYVPGQYQGKQIILEDLYIFPPSMVNLTLEEVNDQKVGLGTTYLAGAFSLYPNVESLDLSGLDTSKVTDMMGMFSGLVYLTSLDVSQWDTSNVEDMSGMFADATSLKTLDVSQWDTSNVMNMSDMFAMTTGLTSLDVSRWDTSNVENMSGMFAMTYSLTSLDVSQWDTSNVFEMSGMFAGTAISTLDVSQWDTSNVMNMSMMFAMSNNLNMIDLSGWDLFNVSNMSMMFFTYNKTPLLIITQNETLKNYDFKSDNRTGIQPTFDANGGTFPDGSSLMKLPELNTLDSAEESFVEEFISSAMKQDELPTREEHRFEGWNATPVASTGLQKVWDQLTQPYTANWGELVDEVEPSIAINGSIEPLILSVGVPSQSLNFVIDPNLEDAFISPTFELVNQSNAPIEIALKSFKQLSNDFNDVSSTKYDDWDSLGQAQSKDIALALKLLNRETQPLHYVADLTAPVSLGVIQPLNALELGFEALHGRSITSQSQLQYQLTFVFGLVD